MMDQLTLSFIGFILGAIGKTSYDFLWKVMENPDLAFDKKYLMTMLCSILITILISPIAFLSVTIPTTDAMSTFFILLTSFFAGFGVNHLLNRPVTYISKKAK